MSDEMRNANEKGSAAVIQLHRRNNPPPADNRRCYICDRHVDELESFGGPGNPLVGDFSGAKLVKTWREEFLFQVGSSWECRDCIVRRGALWELEREDQIGRPLSDSERVELRYEGLRRFHEDQLARQLTAAECEELKGQLNDWQPDEWKSRTPEPEQGDIVTFTAEDLRHIERVTADLEPADGYK